MEDVLDTVAEPLTERAKRALKLASEEARRFNHTYVGQEHLLLGIVREGEGFGAKILFDMGVDLPRVREATAFLIGRGNPTATPADLALTPRLKQAIEYAVEAARNLQHHYVGQEHLLLGLIREGTGMGVRILDQMGVPPDQVRHTILEAVNRARAAAGGAVAMRALAAGATSESRTGAGTIASSGSTPTAGLRTAIGARVAARTRDNVVTCRVDDRTLETLDALVEAGVYTTRSEAAARLILAGIDANQPLLQKVFATVADIRRLRDQAQTLTQDWRAGRAPSDPAPAAESPNPETPSQPPPDPVPPPTPEPPGEGGQPRDKPV
jgi:hypothetical protein